MGSKRDENENTRSDAAILMPMAGNVASMKTVMIAQPFESYVEIKLGVFTLNSTPHIYWNGTPSNIIGEIESSLHAKNVPPALLLRLNSSAHEICSIFI